MAADIAIGVHTTMPALKRSLSTNSSSSSCTPTTSSSSSFRHCNSWLGCYFFLSELPEESVAAIHKTSSEELVAAVHKDYVSTAIGPASSCNATAGGGHVTSILPQLDLMSREAGGEDGFVGEPGSFELGDLIELDQAGGLGIQGFTVTSPENISETSPGSGS
ncbi:hypothetical protein EJB05_45314 [Eragrostis curvula]|uniref:Uncharacterized protein n=1 Tax=Eragrostis curvula TaxID=38414 RepID=A0A5J9TK89_9POAL|nr:hypothetical protein EJB05_45314 [Eragrostis curvula]